MKAKTAIKLLILLVLSCSESEFDSVLDDRQPNIGSGEAVVNIVAEGMPPIKVEPSALYTKSYRKC